MRKSVRRFVAYDPFFTFQEPKAPRFISPGGLPVKLRSGDCKALFQMGSECYELLRSRIQVRSDFETQLEVYTRDLEHQRLTFAQQQTQPSQIARTMGFEYDIDWSKARDDQIVATTSKLLKWVTRGGAKDDSCGHNCLLAMFALLAIDRVIVKLTQGRGDVIETLVRAASALTRAEILVSQNSTLDAEKHFGAKERAATTHTENRQLRKEARNYYLEHSTEFSSLRHAAKQIAKQIVPVKWRTVYDWLRAKE